MEILPAIDLRGGQCVRLRQGDYNQETIFGDPVEMARRFASEGATRLHLVDLDGARVGRPVNHEVVRNIVAAAGLPCQLGGGIRDQAAIEGWLAAGVARVVLGTAALKDPELVREACRRHPGRIAVAIDARGGNVAVEGWAETSDVTTLDLAARFADAGVAAIVFTDVERDGIMEGANVAATARLTQATAIPVIASGGISGLGDLAALKAAGAAGAIVGRALYDGTLDLGQALAQC